MATRKTYTVHCNRCGEDFQAYRKNSTTCPKSECLQAASDEHNAAVAAYNAQYGATRKRGPRRPRVAYGDYAFMVAITKTSR